MGNKTTLFEHGFSNVNFYVSFSLLKTPQRLESTGAALGPPHLHLMSTEAVYGARYHWLCIRAALFFFPPRFWIHANSKRASTISPASILLLHVAMWEKKKKKEKRGGRRDKDGTMDRKLWTVDRFLNGCIGIRDKDLKSKNDRKCWNLWK